MSELVKREKARRVWRLNKKEGVPVLDALETVDISKDVYYRIKDKYEDKWEEEILTVEQIQKRLSEAGETLEKLENKTEQVEERLDDARATAIDVDFEAESLGKVPGLEQDIEYLEGKVKNIEAALGVGEGGGDLERLERKVKQLEALDLDRRLDELERKAENNEHAIESVENKISRIDRETPDSILELL